MGLARPGGKSALKATARPARATQAAGEVGTADWAPSWAHTHTRPQAPLCPCRPLRAPAESAKDRQGLVEGNKPRGGGCLEVNTSCPSSPWLPGPLGALLAGAVYPAGSYPGATRTLWSTPGQWGVWLPSAVLCDSSAGKQGIPWCTQGERWHGGKFRPFLSSR